MKKTTTIIVLGVIVIAASIYFYKMRHNAIKKTTVQGDSAVAGSNKPIAGKYLVKETPDILYATVDGKKLYLDMYTPESATGPLPVVVWTHGGGFHGGTRKTDAAIATSRTLAGHGYITVSVEYRLSNVAKWPAPVHDVNGAIRFLRANAAKYNIDTNRFATMGSSAGSVIANMVGVTDGDPYFTGTVGGNLSQSTNVLGVVNAYGSAVKKYSSGTTMKRSEISAAVEIGCTDITDPDCKKKYETFFPENYLDKNDPAFFVLNGGKDPVSYPQAAIDLSGYMKAAGMDVTTIIDPKYGHGPDITFAHFDDVFTFLDRIFTKS